MPERAVRIKVQGNGVENFIDALKKVGTPSFEVTGGLSTVLKAGFALTQEAVHIGVTTRQPPHLAGTLKASGRTDSDFDGKVWTGSIIYGGRTGTPAYYAIYELNRGGTKADGTPHDFYACLGPTIDRYRDVIDKHMRTLG